MRSYDIETTRELPDHNRILQAILDFSLKTAGVTGCFLSGSTARGGMDADSDLDVGIVFEVLGDRERAWDDRWNWQIARWFHRFDADHIKPYFIIYFYEPGIKADINLYVDADLPSPEGGPYLVAWDKSGNLENWAMLPDEIHLRQPDWGTVVHEDERFWAWMFYLYNHVHRGEYYHCAYEFPALRDILEKWVTRLAGHAHFDSRWLEWAHWADLLIENDLFPSPNLESMKVSMLEAIRLYLDLRQRITTQLKPKWNTSDRAIDKITRLVEGL